MELIQGSTQLLNSFQTVRDTADMEKLDKKSKELLKNKEVLAVILKGVVSEYADYTCEQIMDFIEADSITSGEVSVGRGSTRIVGDDKEFIALGEKTSIFDTKFRAANPRLSTEEITIHIHVDVEPQTTYRPGYPIEKRGIYYVARELSSQFSVVTDDTDYGRLEKCYSIWICRDDVPRNERFSISIYEIQNTHNCGECHPMKENYDLLSLVLIRLGDSVYNGNKEDEGYDVLHFLHTIMYPFKRDFMDAIKEHIDFSQNEELWKEIDHMSGLGMCVMNDGIKQGIEQGEVKGYIKACYKMRMNESEIIKHVADEFDKTIAEAQEIVMQYLDQK